MRRLALALLLLAACGKKEPAPQPSPAPPSESPPAAFEGAILVELVESNEDDLEGPFRIENQIPDTEVADTGTELRIRAGDPAKIHLVVVERRLFLGRGRIGGDRSWRFLESRLALAAPRFEKVVSGGMLRSLPLVVSELRPWPGDLVLRREGDAVVAAIAGKETRVEPGKEAVIGETSAKVRVVKEWSEVGDTPDKVVEKSRNLGEGTFRTRLTIRHLGPRKIEVSK